MSIAFQTDPSSTNCLVLDDAFVVLRSTPAQQIVHAWNLHVYFFWVFLVELSVWSDLPAAVKDETYFERLCPMWWCLQRQCVGNRLDNRHQICRALNFQKIDKCLLCSSHKFYESLQCSEIVSHNFYFRTKVAATGDKVRRVHGPKLFCPYLTVVELLCRCWTSYLSWRKVVSSWRLLRRQASFHVVRRSLLFAEVACCQWWFSLHSALFALGEADKITVSCRKEVQKFSPLRYILHQALAPSQVGTVPSYVLQMTFGLSTMGGGRWKLFGWHQTVSPLN